MGFQTAMEYRLNFLISLISAAYPIIIQTFLWTAIFSSTQLRAWSMASATAR